MKRISNITQTYGNNRMMEITMFLSEQNIKALNLLDVITFSFHNSDIIFKNLVKNLIHSTGRDKIVDIFIYLFFTL